MKPGHIKVTKEAVYARLPDLDDRIIARVEAWRDSVEVGTTATIAEMLTGQNTGPGGALMLTPCPTDMPLEVVFDHLTPADGECTIKGVEVVDLVGPLWEHALGRPKMIRRIA
jgi:hypothetical protein